MEYIPYTYLIGWTELNLWYYGSKYGKRNTHPDYLWKRYFTSSPQVDFIREKYGEPDVIQIRKTFSTAQECTTWEQRVLTKLLSNNNPNRSIWINKNDGFGNFAVCNNIPEYLSIKRTEYYANRTPEQKLIDREIRMRAASNEDGKRKISEKAIARYKDPIFLAKMQALWGSEEYSKIRSEASKKAMDKNGQGYKNHSKVMQSDEYKQLQSLGTIKLFEDPEIQRKHKEGLAKYNAIPENRARKSELAKASSANRIATRHLNALTEDELSTYSFDDICSDINAYYKGADGFDIERLRLKYNKRIID